VKRGKARTQHHAAFIGSTIVFRVQKHPKKFIFSDFWVEPVEAGSYIHSFTILQH